MVIAWQRLANQTNLDKEYHDRSINYNLLLELGMIVEPKVNKRGFREIPILIGMKSYPFATIDKDIHNLCEAWNEGRIKPEEFYKYFEEIHPFKDGNGRVGVLLYNYLRDSLANLKLAPNYWGENKGE